MSGLYTHLDLRSIPGPLAKDVVFCDFLLLRITIL